MLIAGDISHPAHCRAIVERAVGELGVVDILVTNAAHQATVESLADTTDEESRKTFATNIDATFYLSKAAEPPLQSGGAIINTT